MDSMALNLLLIVVHLESFRPRGDMFDDFGIDYFPALDEAIVYKKKKDS